MKVREFTKIEIELSEDEYELLNDARDLLDRIGDTLDEYGVNNYGIYEDYIDGSIKRINELLDSLDNGFARTAVNNQ